MSDWPLDQGQTKGPELASDLDQFEAGKGGSLLTFSKQPANTNTLEGVTCHQAACE